MVAFVHAIVAFVDKNTVLYSKINTVESTSSSLAIIRGRKKVCGDKEWRRAARAPVPAPPPRGIAAANVTFVTFSYTVAFVDLVYKWGLSRN